MSSEETEFRQLNIVGFTIDAIQPLALFTEENGENTFPLCLEMSDILAITSDLVANRLSGKAERNDLLDSLLATINMKICGVLIDGTALNGYLADVCFSGETRVVKVRVDIVTALLTAIKFSMAVSISERAIASSALVDKRPVEPININDEQRFLEILENMTAEEMGKYPM